MADAGENQNNNRQNKTNEPIDNIESLQNLVVVNIPPKKTDEPKEEDECMEKTQQDLLDLEYDPNSSQDITDENEKDEAPRRSGRAEKRR